MAADQEILLADLLAKQRIGGSFGRGDRDAGTGFASPGTHRTKCLFDALPGRVPGEAWFA